MPYGLTLITAATAEPVELDEAKLHLRVEHEADDTLIQGLIAAARQWAEVRTGRALVTQTWKLTLDCWPDDCVIRLPRAPLQSVSAITYVDTAGTTQTWSSSSYRVDATTEPGRIEPAYGEVFPAERAVLAAIAVTFVCGYGAPSAVPQGIKQAMLLVIGHWYENREEVAPGSLSQVPLAAEALLAQFWTGSYV